ELTSHRTGCGTLCQVMSLIKRCQFGDRSSLGSTSCKPQTERGSAPSDPTSDPGNWVRSPGMVVDVSSSLHYAPYHVGFARSADDSRVNGTPVVGPHRRHHRRELRARRSDGRGGGT